MCTYITMDREEKPQSNKSNNTLLVELAQEMPNGNSLDLVASMYYLLLFFSLGHLESQWLYDIFFFISTVLYFIV